MTIIINQLNKAACLNPNESKFYSLKNQPTMNKVIIEVISEITLKTNNQVVNDCNKLEAIKRKKLTPLQFCISTNEKIDNNYPKQMKSEKLKKFDENSPTNKIVSGVISSEFSSTSNLGNLQK